MLIAHLSLLLLMIFVADAAITVWQRGDRRQAVVLGGSIIFFVVAGTGQVILTFWGIIHAPITASLFFIGIVAAMGYELSQDVFRASRLSEDLRDSEERMSLAADAANLGMWVWDVARDEIWMTDKGRDLFGFPPETRVDYAALILRVHPEDRAARAAMIRRALETKGEYAMEYRVLLPDGTLRWIGTRGHCMNVRDPKGIRLLGVSMDVTVQKQVQDALRESEARFRTMADTAPVMIWMSGTDKLCTFFNKGWLDFTGRSLEQELGNGWAEGVHREDFDRCFEVYVNSFDARKPFTMEYRLRRSDGEYRWVLDNGAPRFATDGTFLGYIGSGIDITERKQAQDRFRLVVEASPNGIVLVDAQGHIVLVNACVEETVWLWTRGAHRAKHRTARAGAVPRRAPGSSGGLSCHACGAGHGCRPGVVRPAERRDRVSRRDRDQPHSKPGRHAGFERQSWISPPANRPKRKHGNTAKNSRT